jgi:hypothetical protein
MLTNLKNCAGTCASEQSQTTRRTSRKDQLVLAITAIASLFAKLPNRRLFQHKARSLTTIKGSVLTFYIFRCWLLIAL